LNADFLCERLYDSADPAGMTLDPAIGLQEQPFSNAIDKLRTLQPSGGAESTPAGNPTEAP
jgi:hypothetical protein